jgi:hypothetical protein
MESCRYCARSVSSVRLLVFISFHLHLSSFVKDGAGLFYTTPQPATLNVLRQYALHTLFVPPAPAPDGALDGAAAPARNAFPFSHKPNTLDRDRIVVPAGWDSWGKIAVLRDGFDAKAWGEAWEYDLESGVDSGGSEAGAQKQYAALVEDQGPKARVFHSYYVCIGRLTTIADATSTIQQSNTGASLPREELRRERATRRSRPSGYFPQSRRPLRSASCWPRRTTRFVDLLASGGRTGTCRDGRRW